jgi:2-dehydropantoate 2-reductase
VKVGIIGAGGIGGYCAGLLRRAGVDVRVLARGEHLAAIQEHGLEIRLPAERFVVTVDASSDPAIVRETDYVIVAVKGYSLDEIGLAAAGAAETGAAIVPLLNGVDAAERLEQLGVPREQIVGGLAKISVARAAPGIIERKSAFDRVTLGELDRVPRERTARLVAEMVRAGITATVSDDIALDLWRKFAFIVALNVVCGLSREPVGRVLSSARGRTLLMNSLHEIVEVSRATGAPLSDADETQIRSDLLALPPQMEPSFLWDLERGGPTELDTLAGAVSRIGRAHGVPTPIHDVATAAFDAATQPRV